MAEFVGLTNRVAGTAADGHADVLGSRIPLLPGSSDAGSVVVLVRPESVGIIPDPAGQAVVLAASFLGALCRVQVQLADGDVVLAQVTAAEAVALSPGTRVRVRVHPAPAFAAPAP